MTKSDNCSYEDIYAYIDKESDISVSKKIREHLAACESCRVFYDQVTEMNIQYKQEYDNNLPRVLLWRRTVKKLRLYRRINIAMKLAAPVFASAALFVAFFSFPQNRERMELRSILGQQVYYLQENGMFEDYEDYSATLENTGPVYQYLISDTDITDLG